MIVFNRMREGAGSGAMDDSVLPALLHAAWTRWHSIRKEVYRYMGVSNTEELIKCIINTDTFNVDERAKNRFAQVLREILLGWLDLKDVHREFVRLNELGIRAIPFYSKEYPQELLRYESKTDYIYPPLVLYAKGAQIDVNARAVISVVGTRKCTEWGRKTAYEVGRLVSSKGFTLATGLAEGIDIEAARGALDVGGDVVGVRPWLHPLSLPPESSSVVSDFSEGIMIVAENAIKPKAFTDKLYYLRNRIIAGMAKLVIVVEARDEHDSGSMHQIELALRRNKHVAIFKHPLKGTAYYSAYEKYTARGAISIESLDVLGAMLSF